MKKLATITAAAVLISTEAMASGFNLKEQSISALGNAFAGATAGAEDISYSYFNPAGLTRHNGTKVNAGGTWVAPRSRAKRAAADIPSLGHYESGYTGDIVRSALVPNGYMSHQITDDWYTAISLNVPYGMITKYNDNWAGRMHGTMSKVETITITPMTAYRVGGGLSLGAGLQMQYIRARLRNSVLAAPGREDAITMEGDTFDIGYTVGALYEFNEATRVGIGYRSQIRQKLHGDIDFNLYSMMNQDIDARITTPANLTFGIYHDVNEQWAVMAEIGRTYWSSFDELRIKGENGLLSVTEERWKDTTFGAIGISYKVNEKWKLRGGLAIDQAAVGTYYRTPRIPDSDRIWYSTGVEYKQNDSLTWNVGYTYIRAEKANVGLGNSQYDASRGTLRASYENDVHILGVGLNYNF